MKKLECFLNKKNIYNYAKNSENSEIYLLAIIIHIYI